MKINIERNNKVYVASIYLGGILIWSEARANREAATLAAWETALMIRDIATATEQSVMELAQ